MPKINYSTTKGLYQESGSHIALTGGKLSYRRPVVALTDAAAASANRGALKVTESGTLFTVPALTSGTQTIDLPATSSTAIGTTYSFVCLATTGQILSITGGGSDKIIACFPKGDGDNTAIAQAYATSFSLTAAAVIGSSFSITCVSATAGTAWLVHDVVDGLAANTGSFTAA
jgi:hypothetical protein